jgi:hypothetical protein
VDGRENGENRVPRLWLSIREVLQLSEQLLFIQWPNDILEIHPREGKRRPYGSGLWLGPDLGGKVEPTRLGKEERDDIRGCCGTGGSAPLGECYASRGRAGGEPQHDGSKQKILNVPTAHSLVITHDVH